MLLGLCWPSLDARAEPVAPIAVPPLEGEVKVAPEPVWGELGVGVLAPLGERFDEAGGFDVGLALGWRRKRMRLGGELRYSFAMGASRIPPRTVSPTAWTSNRTWAESSTRAATLR